MGRTHDGHVVRVEGRGTMCESRALLELAEGCLAGGNCSLTIDLSACEYLDSTFLGCLVKLHKRFQSSASGEFRVAADADHRRQLLAPTLLDRFLPLCQEGPDLVGQPVPLTPAEVDPKQLGHHVMECHRLLAEVGGPNQAVFRRIADQLASELEAG